MSSPSPLLCFLILAAAFPLQITAQTYTNITTSNQSLTANDAFSPWLSSPSGDFAFGFQRLPKGGFLLAIWFDQIPEKTVVWSANGGTPAPQGSKVQLTTSGLILTDPEGKRIWSAATLTGLGVTYAAMLNTGNFVVSNQANDTLWETFAHPTDTILPTQTLNQGTRLLSRYSNQNYSVGKFQLSMQDDGNLVSYFHQAFSADNLYGVYWSTGTVGREYQVRFNQTGEIYLATRNGTVLSSVISNSVSSGVIYLRAILEFDGVFRMYAYPSDGRAGANWTFQSNTLPTDMCTAIAIDLGGGVCGLNSYCVMDPVKKTPKCNCPEQYTLIDPESEISGCKPTFEAHSCNAPMSEADHFSLTEIANTNWPNSDYERFLLNVSECRDSCLNDCLCYLAAVQDGTQYCWKKKLPFSSGRTSSTEDGIRAFIKIRKDNSTSTPTPTLQGPRKKKDDNTLIIIGSVLLGTSGAINLLLLWFRSQGKRKEKVFPPSTVSEGASVQNFTYMELKEATGGFKEELGKGAFGAVYKGEISSSHGKSLIAVKVLNRLTVESEKEFKAEVNTISRTNHRNLVQLIGFCSEGENRLLVYEFMENGSLANYLFGTPRPSWYQRVEIALGIGRGLLYLHEEGSKQIMHCDIKPQNILLDSSFIAKISDFGLAKLLMTDQTRTVTAIRGTRGYLAPEWFRNKPVSVKVDVFGFGILLLELICCRKNYELNSDEENQTILSDWVFDCYHERMLHLLVEKDEEAHSDMETVRRFVMTAMWCIQEDPSLRPSMKNIMQMLEGTAEVSAPTDPSSFISSI